MEKTNTNGQANQTNSAQGFDRGYSWVIFGANTLAFCVATGFLLTTGIVHTTLEEKFHAGAAKTSLVGSAFDAMFFLLGPLGSILTDKTSCRCAIVTGSLVMCVGFFITAFSTSLDLCILSCGFLAGLGGGLLHSALFVVIGFNFKQKYSVTQGTVVASGGIGLFAMAPLLETVKESYGFPGVFIIMAAISLQMLACGLFMRPSKMEISAKRRRSLKSLEGQSANFKQTLKTYTSLLFNKVVICLSLSILTMNGAMYSIFILWPSFCKVKGFSPMQASFVLSTAGIASVFGRFLIGLTASFQRVHEVTLYCTAYLILAIPFLCFNLYSHAYVGHLVVAVFVGLLSGAAFVLVGAINTKYLGLEFVSASIGIEFFFGGLGAISLPSLSGVLVSKGLDLEHVFLISGVFLLLAGILCFAIRFVAKPLEDQLLEVDILSSQDRQRTGSGCKPNVINQQIEPFILKDS